MHWKAAEWLIKHRLTVTRNTFCQCRPLKVWQFHASDGESLAVPFAAPAGRGLGGIVVHGLRGRDILELDGCWPRVLLRDVVCLEE